MNTCSTCRWWGPPAHDDSLYRPCTKGKLLEFHEWCDAGMPSDAVRYEYSESGGFDTGRDFGCIHWQSFANGSISSSQLSEFLEHSAPHFKNEIKPELHDY